MRRLHLAKEDLKWLPKGYRTLRTAIVGSVLGVLGGGVAATLVYGGMHGVGVFIGKGFVFVGSAGYWVGDRISKLAIASRLGKLASGDVDLGRLSNSEDGDLVHVRGTIRAQQTVPSRMGAAPGVYRRVRLAYADMQAIEEVGVDFQLVDAEGNAIGIEVERARWIVHDGKRTKVERAMLGGFKVEPDILAGFDELPALAKYMKSARRMDRTVRATEAMLRDGDTLEVVGYKSRQVDQSMADRMMRETPMRATLRGGKELPLILSRVERPA